ncbi:MAG: SDR family NAD(P)-dependent oxidoreductase [Rubrivivax sp.]
MHDLFDLHGRVALVTGATGGLGAAIAQAFAAAGATLVLSDLDPGRCEAAAVQFRSTGTSAVGVAADLGDASAIDRLASAAVRHCGRVDVLVCNAGVQGPAGPIGEAADQDWDEVMDINLRSALRLARALVPGMASRREGSVILMSSIAGLRGNKAIGLYGLSKAALAQLARNLAIEWGPMGVRANAISPGLIRTPLATELLANEAFMARRLALTPLRRVGEPSEVAAVALLLASRAGGFITGQNIVVDGGTTVSDGS